jgi:hypothetical protein
MTAPNDDLQARRDDLLQQRMVASAAGADLTAFDAEIAAVDVAMRASAEPVVESQPATEPEAPKPPARKR